jgi:hypothetical protein
MVMAPKKHVTLKRWVGYADEEVGKTNVKLSRMDIDGDSRQSSEENIGGPSSESLN